MPKSFDEIKIDHFNSKDKYDEAIVSNFKNLIYACIFINEKNNYGDTTSKELYNFLLRYNYPKSYIDKNLQSYANSISGQGYIVIVSKKHYRLSTNINI